jgi:putative chitinase
MAKEVISGRHQPNKSWDGAHKFGSGDKTWANLHGFNLTPREGTGGGNGIIPKALRDFYKKYNLNPCITSVKLTVDPKNYTLDYEFTIEESPDGNAYVGFSSWGGASGGYPKKLPPSGHAYKNYKKEYDGVLNNHKGSIIKDVIDFYIPGGFRQICFQFTWPSKYPNLPKSANAKTGTVGVTIGPSGSPKNLPENNGVLVQTTSIISSGGQVDRPQNTDSTGSNSGASGATSGTAAGSPEDDIKNGTVKIKLVKKSGPGELMGIVEFTSYFGEAVIEGLQFDEPGEYVIQAVTNDPNVKPTEFTITVTGDPNPESVEKQVEKPVEGSRPIIAQIDKPSISLKPIDFEILNSDAQLNIETAKSMGLTPFLWYNGYQIKIADIKSLSLFHEGLTPCTQVQFIDSTGIIKKDGFPLDDTTFEIFLNSGSPMLKSIHMKFKVKDFQQNKVGGTYTMTGQIDLKSYHKINFKSYKGTSFEVLREISKELELGFNSNIQNTNDSMNWFNTGLKYRNFVSNIVKNSYIDDQSFVMAYIDFYYCFNYVDVEKEWRRDISSDVGVSSGALSQLGSAKTEDKIVSLLLTNDASSQGTDLYFTKYKLRNNSTSKSLEAGQKTVTKYYDKNKKSFLIFDVEAQTTPGSDKIILKGKPSDTKDLNENYRTVYGGKIDLDNSHSNFKYAKTQNERNLNELNKISVDIEMEAANFNFYKFQKIRILFVNAAGTVTDPDITQQRISGDWMIIEITYNWSGGKLKQNLVCVRKELEKTDEEKSEQTTKAEPEKKSDEKNEEVKVVPPNSEFEPGETYTVKDKGGKIYTVTIEKLLENGNEVQGYTIEEVKEEPPAPTPPGGSGTDGSGGSGTDGSGGSGTDGSGGDSTQNNIPEVPYKPGVASKTPPAEIIKAMKDYGITSPLEQAHFLAQCAHESGNFQWKREFASGKAYEGRDDLGNTQPGDGVRYKGRGYIQITGRANYTAYNKYLKSKGINDDVVANPTLLEGKFAADCSVWFWKIAGPKGVKNFPRKSNEGATEAIVTKISAWVNGGTNGLKDRLEKFGYYWSILKKDGKAYK